MLPPFQDFLDDHGTDVWRFLVACVGPVEAEDCFQETFAAALTAYPKLRNADNLRSWVLTIAHRKAIDNHRRYARRAQPSRPPTVDGPAEPDPELWAAVRGLPDRQREAVAHRFVNDLSYKQIAQVMTCTPEAARQNVREGLKKLREVLRS